LAGYGVNFTFASHTDVFACADLLEEKILQVKVVQKYERVFCVSVRILVFSVPKLMEGIVMLYYILRIIGLILMG